MKQMNAYAVLSLMVFAIVLNAGGPPPPPPPPGATPCLGEKREEVDKWPADVNVVIAQKVYTVSKDANGKVSGELVQYLENNNNCIPANAKITLKKSAPFGVGWPQYQEWKKANYSPDFESGMPSIAQPKEKPAQQMSRQPSTPHSQTGISKSPGLGELAKNLWMKLPDDSEITVIIDGKPMMFKIQDISRDFVNDSDDLINVKTVKIESQKFDLSVPLDANLLMKNLASSESVSSRAIKPKGSIVPGAQPQPSPSQPKTLGSSLVVLDVELSSLKNKVTK